MDQARLRRIRNFQSDDWYAALILRPLCVAIMLVVADWKWLTANLVTTLATLAKLGGAALLLAEDRTLLVVGVVLLQVGALLDHLDGNIARYRRTFTAVGSFYDKVSDAITWFAIMMAAGWAAYSRSGDARMLLLAAVGAHALMVMGYMKWLVEHSREQVKWLDAVADPQAAIAKNTAPPRVSEPPVRTRRDWVVWFFKSLAQVYRFEEMDLYFWLGLAVIIDRIHWFLLVTAATQVFVMLTMIVRRFRQMAAVDARRRAQR